MLSAQKRSIEYHDQSLWHGSARDETNDLQNKLNSTFLLDDDVEPVRLIILWNNQGTPRRVLIKFLIKMFDKQLSSLCCLKDRTRGKWKDAGALNKKRKRKIARIRELVNKLISLFHLWLHLTGIQNQISQIVMTCWLTCASYTMHFVAEGLNFCIKYGVCHKLTHDSLTYDLTKYIVTLPVENKA